VLRRTGYDLCESGKLPGVYKLLTRSDIEARAEVGGVLVTEGKKCIFRQDFKWSYLTRLHIRLAVRTVLYLC
jgi:hypothetical protein